jgi:phosphotransferase system HPr (HPr) family protein
MKIMNEKILTELEIINKKGLHARASKKLVECANLFESDIKIGMIYNNEDQDVSCREIMDLMMLEANYGKKVRLSIIGPDAHRAFKAIKELFNNQFYE